MNLRPALTLLTFSALSITPIFASEGTEDEWQFAFSPYFWGAGISGDVGQFNLPKIEMDSSFSDIWKDLDFSFMAIAEARKGRFSLFSDVVYTKISSRADTPRGVLVDHINVKSETFAGVLGAGYAIVETDRALVDWVAGARLWHASTDINFKGGLVGDRSGHDSDTWVDAVTGLRGRYALTPEIYLSGWGLIGAGEADLDWDVAATVGYQFSNSLSAVAGYRALGVDYNKGSFVYDVVQKGPVVGVVMRF
ncbi:hypothetical protein WG219_02465 [Ectopseudomonas mendocina]|uniref:Outer membrane protein beta-barrel domain-containing protein n=1 Tax=Ectopseudomonas mendocina TaxID=300 RepID=A0ABZ2RJW2_ECTME